MKSSYLAPLTCAALLFACATAYSNDAGKSDMQRESATHRDFDSVDTHRHGYLTSDDVKHDDWVSKNWSASRPEHVPTHDASPNICDTARHKVIIDARIAALARPVIS